MTDRPRFFPMFDVQAEINRRLAWQRADAGAPPSTGHTYEMPTEVDKAYMEAFAAYYAEVAAKWAALRVGNKQAGFEEDCEAE